jgi:hypothetical protein
MPDIPVTQDTGPAQNLVALGQGVMKVGAALGNVASQYDQQQAQQALALQKSVSATQFLQARQYYDEQNAVFMDNLKQDPNHSDYVNKYDEFHQKLVSDISQNFSVQGAKDLFQSYDTEQYKGYIDSVVNTARQGAYNDAASTVTSTLQKDAASGNVDQLQKDISFAVDHGMTKSTEAELTNMFLMDTKKQSAINELSNLPYQDALSATLDNKFAIDHGLTANDMKDVVSTIKDRKALSDSIVADQKKKVEDDTFNSFIKDVSTDKVYSKDELASTLQTVQGNAHYYTVIQGYADAVEKERQKNEDLLLREAQTGVYTSYGTNMEKWSGNGVGPWTLDDIKKLSDDKKITEKEWNSLKDIYTSKMNDIQSGRGGGPLYDDATKVAQGWNIVYNLTNKSQAIGATNKKTALDKLGFLGNGISGPTYGKMYEAIDTFEANKDRDPYFTPLQNWYDDQRAVIVQSGKGASALQELDYKKSVALQTMQDFMTNNPTDKEAWGRQRDQMMLSDISLNVRKQVEAKLGDWFAVGTPQGVVLDTALEQFPNLKDNPQFMGEFKNAMASGSIENAEKQVLSDKGIKNITKSWAAPDQHLLYQDSSGEIYRVVGADVPGTLGARIKNVVEKRIGDKWVRQ